MPLDIILHYMLSNIMIIKGILLHGHVSSKHTCWLNGAIGVTTCPNK